MSKVSTSHKKRKNSRSKGKRGERAVAHLLKAWWGSEFTSTPSSGGFRTKKFRDDWNAAADIVTPDETFPFSVEVKHHEGWTLDQLITAPRCEIWTWWDQCVRECPEGKIPLLLFRRNNMPWMYMIHEAAVRSYLVKGSRRLVTATIPSSRQTVQIGLFEDMMSGSKAEWT